MDPRDGGYISPFALLDRQFAEMDREMEEMSRQLDREMSSMLGDVRRTREQVDADVERALGQAREGARGVPGGPDVRIVREEQRGPGTYRYYESITSYGGTGYLPAVTAAPPLFSPLLLVATLLAGAYAALTAQFARNFSLTTYKEGSRWLLSSLWPLLALFNPSFREQFWGAVRGVDQAVPPQQQGQHGRRGDQGPAPGRE